MALALFKGINTPPRSLQEDVAIHLLGPDPYFICPPFSQEPGLPSLQTKELQLVPEPNPGCVSRKREIQPCGYLPREPLKKGYPRSIWAPEKLAPSAICLRSHILLRGVRYTGWGQRGVQLNVGLKALLHFLHQPEWRGCPPACLLGRDCTQAPRGRKVWHSAPILPFHFLLRLRE